MNFLGIGSVVESVGKVIDDLHTSDKERGELALREKEIDQRTDLAQTDVNRTEAQHSSLFVAGWRPAIGWIGAVALGYQFILYPLLIWAWTWLQSIGYVPAGHQPPPMLQTDALWVILSGMLGIAGLRSVEKVKGVAR
jgi:hypothetical protein